MEDVIHSGNDSMAERVRQALETKAHLLQDFQDTLTGNDRSAQYCKPPVKNDTGSSQDALDIPPLKQFAKENGGHLPKGKDDFGAFLLLKNKDHVDTNKDGVLELSEIKAFAADKSLGKLSRDSVSSVAKHYDTIKGYVNDAAGVGLSSGDLQQTIARAQDCAPTPQPGPDVTPPVQPTPDVPQPQPQPQPQPETDLHINRKYDALKILDKKENFDAIDADHDGYLRVKEIRHWLRDPYRETRLEARELDGINKVINDFPSIVNQSNDQTGREIGAKREDLETTMKKLENRYEKRTTGLR